MQFNLVPHPAAPPRQPPFDVWVHVEHAHLLSRTPSTNLVFCVGSPMDRFVVPTSTDADRAGDLWRSTCFEFFVRPIEQDAYREWNFAPSTNWAAYDFAEYRSGRANAAVPCPPCISLQDNLTWWEVAATVANEFPQPWAVALSAILEEKDGTKSYWALAHPPGDTPDFHAADCFAARLP